MNKITHATKADIEAILKARREAAIEVQAIPALPPARKAEPAIAAQSLPTVPITEPVAVPVVETAPEPEVPDAEVEDFLAKHLPALIQAARDLATPPFQFAEVVNLGAAVSAAVSEGLPQVRGKEARALVVVVSRHLWRTYATPLLPAPVRMFAPLLETLLIAGIEAAYQLVVKPTKR